ncbi:Uncharacterised protein [Klebsiella pneumoniae]|nr:Uncharacterised protein [Klebsiella pneumoniae]CAA0235287.1 Uncharacterised protein [Klebsiella pneumoniae]SAR59118.1 Uncharacterised protein [Klebsiella pneumoniae]SAS12644.1 Uncharacterised protein [Klebsiella pneumoniae]SAS82532.1 Uncharacterised protein [Klebsiella pneumoniae]
MKLPCSCIGNNVRNDPPDLQPVLIVIRYSPEVIQLIEFLETPLGV